MAEAELLKLKDVPAFIQREYGMTVSLATVYNWVSKGRHGRKLATLPGPRKLTARSYVRRFVSGL